MADKPSVSVIIPTYNRASLIGAAIQSVLNQTFKSVEIIVVDDGSTDETQRALEPYAGKIVSLTTKNNGPAHARNVGMKAASGKYVAFLDSDDMYLPHKLELEVAFMETNPDIGMVSTNMSAMSGGEIVEEYHLNRYHSPIFHDYGWTLEDIYSVRDGFEFHGQIMPCYTGNIFKYMLHWPALFSNSVVFPREILQVVGYQNEAYRVGEDYDYAARICKHFSVAFLDIPTYVYRYNEDQITMLGSPWSTKRHATWIRILETFIQIARYYGEADIDYYSQNKAWLDPLLSKKYLELGRNLIGHGDSKKAQVCFSKAYDYDPSHEAFFCKLLGDVDDPTVPFGLANVQGDGSEIAEARRPVDATLARRLRERARALGVSAASMCHVAWAQVLARVSARDFVVFGTVLYGHMQGGESADRILGPCINTLPIRILVGNISVQESVRHTHSVLSQLLRHEHAPLALAQRCSAVAAPAPLFCALLDYRHSNTVEQDSVEASQTKASTEFLGLDNRTHYPLMLSVNDLGEGFSLTAQARSPIDPKRICAYMHTALEQLITALETSPAAPLRSLNVFPEAERHQLLVEWNNTARDYGRQARMHRLVEQQVATTPDAVALEFEGQTLTYAEVNRRANQLARVLRERGVGPDVLVGVFAERSFEMVLALLAVLKAGGAYVPLDPSYPAERLGHMLEDARAPVVLAQAHLAPQLPPQTGEVLLLDASWTAYSGEAGENLEDLGTPRDLAYVIFTSGSTGRPKGAMNEHRGICNRLQWMQEEYGLSGDDRVLQKTPFSFDVSVWELFWPLMTGARLVIARPEGHRDSAYLVALIRESGITTLHFVPSMLRVFLEEEGVEACGSLRRVICSGEALPHELQERFFGRLPKVALHNLYGPTEAAVDVTYWACQQGDERLSVPIGRPVANTQIYVLDARMQPAPVGVAGELYIGGVQVGRGYVGRDDLTAERFVPDPFSSAAGARLYKTGDLARHLVDGAIEYLGRLDYQVKIRGQRIELGEIEATLSKHTGVGQSVVTAREDTPGDQRLVAYVVAREVAPSTAELKEHLSRELPAYMVPSAFVFLDALPLTSSGKLDRNLLPEPERSSREANYVAPRTPVETVLAGIWADALKFERIGMHDNFFELGGHSLLATQVIFRVRTAFQIEMSLRILFDAPTVAQMAAVISRLQSENGGAGDSKEKISEPEKISAPPEALPVIVPNPGERYLPFPLTDVQQAYWLGRTDNFALGNVASHFYQELDCAGLDLARFNRAWQRLIERHDMLRAIVLPDGRQQILAQVPPYEIEILDLRGQDGDTKAKELKALRQRMSHQVLQSDRWPLFEIRASLLDDGLVRLHWSTDSLMSDAWSGLIIARELVRLYKTPDAILEPVEISFRDYVLADLALRDSGLYRRSKDYWWSRLPTLPPAPEMPLVKDPGSITMPRFVRRRARLEPDLWSRLKTRATRVGGLTASGLLLAAFAEVLKVWSKSPRFTINLTLFNRLPLHPQVNDVVGDFTSLVLLAVDGSEEDTFEGRARRLQQQLWQDLDHRYVSGLQVMRELARRQGGVQAGRMPVVFTSTFGEGSAAEFLDQLGPVVYSIGQTPQVWLDHVVSEMKGALNFHWDVIEELFPSGLLDDMFDSYCRFLRRLAEEDNALGEIWSETARNLIPARQLRQRAAVNDTGAPLTDDLLHTLFAEQVPQRPQQAAMISADRTLTYEELYRCANRIGRWLRDNGARRNTLVAVVMEKGWEQVAGVLGVLASGAAYTPIDAGLPKDRLGHLLQHGEVELVLTQPQFDKKIEWPETVKRLIIDDDNLSGLDDQPHHPIQSPEDIAYVIYTSGSTGLPKGVVIDHRGAVNTILDLNRRFTLTPKDRVLALSSLSFDLSVYDIFGILAAGGTIVFPDAAGLRDPAHWADLIARHRVTLWNSVPALMQMLVEYLEGRRQRLAQDLRLVFMSGDWIPVALPERILALHGEVEIISMGGATEASIWSIIYPIEKVDRAWKSIAYGRPMMNQTFHVLNEALEPCPVWVPGQLYIGGIGLAKGYWRDEEKTNASFITHPRTGQRLYRTGDQGRYLPDGNIEFLGRDDFQVKVQGYRVELGEIETILSQHPQVQTAVVTATGAAAGNKRLVAYVVLEGEQAFDDRQDEGLPKAGNGESNGWRAPDEILRDPLARLKFKLKKPGMRINNGRASIRLRKTEPTDKFLEPYVSRRSYRKFTSGTVSFDRFSHFLNSLSPVKIDDTPFPKYRYASAGGLYPVQTYVYIKADRVESLAGGTYFYDAGNHSIVSLYPNSQIHSTDFQGSPAIFDQSAFALFFVGQLKSIAPMYGEMARDFCVIEAGSMCQLLETLAPSHQIGLCQIGGLDFQPIRHLFDLEESHLYLHCLLGGPIAAQQAKRQAFVEEMSEYAKFLRTLEEPPTSSHFDQGMAEELRAFLQGKLPDYMIPANFVFLDKLPLSSNGKVDRKALPEPATLNAERVEDLRKEWTGQTARIASLVEDVLKVKNFDPETNLFDLGVTSVDVIRIINSVERELDFRPKIEAFYRLPTVAALINSYEQHLLHKSSFQEFHIAITQGDQEEGTL